MLALLFCSNSFFLFAEASLAFLKETDSEMAERLTSAALKAARIRAEMKANKINKPSKPKDPSNPKPRKRKERTEERVEMTEKALAKARAEQEAAAKKARKDPSIEVNSPRPDSGGGGHMSRSTLQISSLFGVRGTNRGPLTILRPSALYPRLRSRLRKCPRRTRRRGSPTHWRSYVLKRTGTTSTRSTRGMSRVSSSALGWTFPSG
ncbi:uncharacterized protein LOC125494617 [Beta vulgaris subsp. vulgaris]|uniref:uncharacterized protein LOC125494617 n=1 Tax=Beta vulgaris subsp. vulgaris TaxID=3555 RepID=UPI002548BC35|nr:uncharacterized protein LOC125494617 [Beta vulgaris subsp. vulgaris]